MPADTKVKLFHSTMIGAPGLNGVAGVLISLLDACLVNGFGLGAVDSISITDGVALATRGGGHSFQVGSVVEIAGATVTGGSINGQHRVTETTSTTYKFEVAGGIPNQLATGSPTHKLAPAGWEKRFAGTNLAVYRSQASDSRKFNMRVDDTNALYARVRGYEVMTDLNTGTGLFPTDTQVNGGLYWPKSNVAGADPRDWTIVADDKRVYFCCNWSNFNSVVYSIAGFFGDLAGASVGDNYAAALYGHFDTDLNYTYVGSNYHNRCLSSASTSNSASCVAPRNNLGMGSSQGVVRSYKLFSQGTNVQSGANVAGHIAFPNPAGNDVFLSEVTAVSVTPAGSALRGRFPGFYGVPQVVGAGYFSHLARLTAVEGYPGRTFAAVNNANGVSFFDVTGPWD